MFLMILHASLSAATPAVPVGVEGVIDGFHVVQLAVDDIDRLEREWAIPGAGVTISTTSRMIRNKPVFTTVNFGGCTPDAKGNCRITVAYEVRSPNGSLYAPAQSGKSSLAFEGAISDPAQFYLGGAYLGIRIEPGEALGRYTINATTTDAVAHRVVVTQMVLEAVEAE